MPILDLNKMKVESKVHELWRKACDGGRRALNYVNENKETVVIAATAVTSVLGAGKWVAKNITQHKRTKEIRDLKELHVYDRSTNAYLRLRRPLRNADWRKINERRQKGEKMADILDKMDLLK